MMTMREKNRLRSLWLIVAFMSPILLGGCFSSSESDEVVDTDSGIYFDISSVDYAAISVDESTLALGARQLAAQCAQCHGTYGVAVRNWPDLHDASGLSNTMLEYQDVDVYGGSSMHLHALAYTADEVNLLKTYYSKVSYTPAAGGE
ncbi:MAG: hypothetical protein U9N57_03320 [Pseudomonadota bacterium]|nr:hypothetical protein [Pseudomonadota bacterium]